MTLSVTSAEMPPAERAAWMARHRPIFCPSSSPSRFILIRTTLCWIAPSGMSTALMAVRPPRKCFLPNRLEDVK